MDSYKWKNSRCPGCKEDLLSLQPKLLSCFHSVCSRCIINSGNNQMGGKGVVCIICKQESNLGSIIDNEFIKDIPGTDEEDLTNVTCTSCDDGALATSFCPECEDYLCETCVMAHGRTKLTKHHKIKPKEEIKQHTSFVRTCTDHEYEKLTWYCVDCSKVTCRDCQLNNHRNHEYVPVDEVSDNELGKIKKVMKELEASLPTLRNTKASIMKSVSASEKEEDEIKIAVTEQGQNIKKLVEEWESSLLSMLHNKVKPYKKLMTNSIMEVDNVITSIMNASQFIEQVVAQSNVVSILKSKDFIIKELEQLLEKGKVKPVINTNSYQFFREKSNILANCIKKSAYIFEKPQNIDSQKFLIASISAADQINEEKLVQCRSCHSLTDFGPTCESCGMPIPHNLNPEKRQTFLNTVKNEDPNTDMSINQESNENVPCLENVKIMQSDQEVNNSKKQSPVKKGVEQSENTEKSPAEKKFRPTMIRSSQKEKKTASNSTAASVDNDSGSEELDNLQISSSSEDETYVPKKQAKQHFKRSCSFDSRPTSSAKKPRGRPSKASSCRSTPQSSRSSVRDLGTPSTSGTQPSPKLDLSTLTELRQLMLKCRSIRIGSLKTIPRNSIDISVDGIDMVITNLKEGSGRGFNLLIPSKMIKEVSCHFGRSLPIMFIYTHSSFKDEIEKKFGADVFDPDSDDEAKKRIIILPEKFGDEDRITVKNIFKDIGDNFNQPELFMELDVKAANAILVMSTPADQK